MQPELMTTAGLILAALLTTGAADAAEQIITPAPLQRTAAPDQPVAFTVGYGTANPCSDHLTGLGLRIHWDADQFAFVSLAGVRAAALVAQGPVEDDTADGDADPATDKFVQVAWADMDGAWPGGGCTATTLYTANFRTLAGLTGSTPIRFSAGSTAAGYAFSAVPAAVTLPSYSITATANPVAGGTAACTPNPVPHGASSTCTAMAKTGYAFTAFSGACTGASCVLGNVTSARSVTASFTALGLAINDVTQAEGNVGTSAAVFTVTLSPAGPARVTVRYATANGSALAGSDYTAASGILTFCPGQTSKTLTVNLRGDTGVEPDETFAVKLSAPTGAILLDGQCLGTILNDD